VETLKKPELLFVVVVVVVVVVGREHICGRGQISEIHRILLGKFIKELTLSDEVDPDVCTEHEIVTTK
jgi:hypothetical protein